jgi:hypothetical protein
MSKAVWKLTVLAAGLCAAATAQQTSESHLARTVEFGFEQRVRNENWNNLFDFSGDTDDEREQIRYRTRLWSKMPLSPNVDFFVGLNQETNQKFGKVNRFDEVVFDNAYLDFKQLFLKGLSLRVGRQNLTKGEGFLIFEGNPGDGSRSIYFNGFDLAYTRKKSQVELIGILNPREDRFLPRIHNQHKLLQNGDEQALGLYYTDNNLTKTSIEAYYFYKKEVHDSLPPMHPQFQPDRHVSTFGGRVVRQLGRNWSVTGEFGAQWGAQRPDVKVGGRGGYGYVKRTFRHSWQPYATAGYWGFSGDDPATVDRVEGWDPLFARWPKWSELYIYSQFREAGVGYWTNTGMWQAETGLSPRKPLGVRLTYYRMDASHPFRRGDGRIFGDGTRRGDMLQAKVDLAVGANWRGHVLYEGLLPGDFYRVAHKAYLLRFEVSCLIKTSFHLNGK